MVMCAWVQNRIPAYLSGELGARQAKWLRWHVDQCHVCQKALKTLGKLQAIVESALPVDLRAPESLNDRVMHAIDQLPPSPGPPKRRFRWSWRR